jgi:cell division protein FtsQ
MARRSGSTIQEELYSTPDDPAREALGDARLLDLDAEKESPFLRAQKRVSARRSPLPKKTAARLLWALLAIVVAALGAVGAASFYHYAEHSWRFRLESSDDIEMAGLSNATHGQIMEVMGGDIGRNVFFIPLEQRQKQLEQIPWVESVSVMRFAPNRLKIQIRERTPVAFARVGAKVMLVDAGGVLMDLSSKKKYSFPVIVGMNSGEPLSTRAARMRIYNQLVRQIDFGGGRYSQDLSEVDLSDPEDVKVMTNDPAGEVLVHLGSSSYLDRFKIYVAHLREWREQFEKLESVDLRYDRQIIVNPDLRGSSRQPALTAAAAKAAISAGVKPAALISREPVKSTVPHAVAIGPVVNKHSGKDSPSPTISQKARKDGAPAVSRPSIKSANAWSVRHRHRTWSKHVAKHGVVKPARQTFATAAPKSIAAVQKPSPSIAKGQGSR